MGLSEHSIDSIPKIWGLDDDLSPFHYAEKALDWSYSPTSILKDRFRFRFVLVKKDERFYKWVPIVDWRVVRKWLYGQAQSLRHIYKYSVYDVARERHLFEESDIETVIYQLQRLQKSLKLVHRKTVGRLMRRSVVTLNGEMFVGTDNRAYRGRTKWVRQSGYHEGLGGPANSNKAPRSASIPYWMTYRKQVEDRRIEQQRKELVEAHTALLLEKKLERRAKIAAKKKNRKYNRAVVKGREQQGKDYIWW